VSKPKHNKQDYITIKEIASELGISYMTAWQMQWVRLHNIVRYGVSKNIALPIIEEYKNNKKIASTHKEIPNSGY
jgi:hypothetical protein